MEAVYREPGSSSNRICIQGVWKTFTESINQYTENIKAIYGEYGSRKQRIWKQYT